MLFARIAFTTACILLLEVVGSPVVIHARENPTRKRQVPAFYSLHERQDNHWSAQWTRKDRIPAQALLPMRIGLVQSNMDAGASILDKISNPRSADYGKHLSVEEVIETFAPPEAAVKAVKDWLVGAGYAAEAISLSADKQWILFDSTAEKVEHLLVAEFFEYEHLASGSKTIAVGEYHVPLHLVALIDYITPGIKLQAQPSSLKRLHTAPSLHKAGGLIGSNEGSAAAGNGRGIRSLPPLGPTVCDTHVTAACIRAQYTIPSNNTLAAVGNELGIFAGLDAHYGKGDLDAFFTTLHPHIPKGTYPEERLIDGAIGSVEDVAGYNRWRAGVEADMDIEAAWPLIWPQKIVLFPTDDQYYQVNQTAMDSPYRGYWNTFFDAIDGSYCTYSAYNETGDCTRPECLDPVYPDPNPGGYQGQRQCGVYRPTNVVSISYSGGEADLPRSYLKRQCHEIMKLSLQGVTVVESSGDFGVAGTPGSPSMLNGCAGPHGKVFYPSADVTCPYVLAVGSTRFNHKGSGRSSTYDESSLPGSGGGFSNYFDAAPWQVEAISDYFNQVTLNFTGYENPGVNFGHVGQGVFRTGGRGYPDVSAIGVGYLAFAQGRWSHVGGSSLSAPIWAAVITLINERRLAANKSTVGFVHPVLYAHPEVFNDVTKGSNPGCNSTGFPTARGWDPVSGLG